MKQDMKKWLTLHKGKALTKEVIEMISQRHEDEIHSMIYNEGVVLTSSDNSNIICIGDDKDFAVQDWQYKTLKEFKTLQGALNFINRK